MTAPGPAFIGLTGALAAGKSETLAALGRLGAATLSTDSVAHAVLDEEAVRAQLIERWGPEIAGENGVNRERVGAIVFEQPTELAWLESVTHPLVGQRVFEFRTGVPGGTELAVVEVPLLFEAEMEGFFDATLVVVAGDERRAEFAAARGTSAVEGRSDRQLSEDEKASRATFVVRNDGSLEDLEQRLRDLWPQLIAARAG